MSPHQATAPYDWPALLRLLQTAFAEMELRIAPPSSVHRLTEAAIAAQAAAGEVWVIGAPPLACVFFTPQPGCLYLGKLAVAEQARRRGLARRLVALAETRARALGLPALELQSRVELAENHAAFAAMGFAETGRTAHAGFAAPTSITFRKPV